MIEHFVAGATARTTAEIVGVNKNTAQLFFHKLRLLITKNQQMGMVFQGEVEADESYFGGKRKGKRGRGAGGKIPVFGLLKRGGRVFADIITDAKSSTLIPIIEEKVLPDSIVYTDTFNSTSVPDSEKHNIAQILVYILNFYMYKF